MPNNDKTPNSTTPSVKHPVSNDGANAEHGTSEWWLSSIQSANEIRKNYSFISRWGDFENYYTHKHWGENELVYNTAYMYGRSMIPNLVFKNPTIINTPRFPQHIPFASIMDSIDAWLMDEMELESIAKSAVLYAYLYNMAPVEVGYDFPELPGSGEEDQLKAAFMANMGVMGVSGGGGTNRARRQNFPWLDLVPPRLITFDPLTTSMRTCRWYAKSLFTPTRLLEADKSLKNGTVSSTHVPQELMADDVKDIYEKLVGLEPHTHFYEVHNAETQEMFWLSDGGQFMFDPIKDPMQFDGLPLETLVFNENPLSIWGTPDMTYIEPMMKEGNETRQLGLKQRRVALLKIIADQDAFDPEELEKLFTDDVAVLRTRPSAGNNTMQNKIMQLQQHVQGEFIPYQQNLDADSQRILGFGQNQLGAYHTGRRTAKEASIVQEQNEIRVVERRYMVANMIAGIFRKVNQSIFRYWTQPILVRVIGVDGALYWVNAAPKDVKAEMALKVDVESMLPPSKESQKQDLLQLAQVLSNVKNANIVPLIRKLLSKYPEADASLLLPTGNNEPMGAQEFGQQQQKQIASGEAQTNAKTNTQALFS